MKRNRWALLAAYFRVVVIVTTLGIGSTALLQWYWPAGVAFPPVWKPVLLIIAWTAVCGFMYIPHALIQRGSARFNAAGHTAASSSQGTCGRSASVSLGQQVAFLTCDSRIAERHAITGRDA